MRRCACGCGRPLLALTPAPAHKVGVLVLMTPGQDQADALVVLRYRDFVDLHGTPKEPPCAS